METYSLSPAVQLGWLPSGDHSFKPTRSSGLSEAENWATAVAWSDRFLAGGAQQLSTPGCLHLEPTPGVHQPGRFLGRLHTTVRPAFGIVLALRPQ